MIQGIHDFFFYPYIYGYECFTCGVTNCLIICYFLSHIVWNESYNFESLY
ncbi:hypothetical protein HMPREF9441_01520 [Paraprevotella clara YIT 11840]|uniref:Uncharacterized protein n=1 Tax=Paraprevotella clara YIT 11840 TaxID=762968 RepID=G5SQ83_9BACT|nr:hypothetical protein HMPREF9441_01520 [Paraprevotella clara YIT 11840]